VAEWVSYTEQLWSDMDPLTASVDVELGVVFDLDQALDNADFVLNLLEGAGEAGKQAVALVAADLTALIGTLNVDASAQVVLEAASAFESALVDLKADANLQFNVSDLNSVVDVTNVLMAAGTDLYVIGKGLVSIASLTANVDSHISVSSGELVLELTAEVGDLTIMADGVVTWQQGEFSANTLSLTAGGTFRVTADIVGVAQSVPAIINLGNVEENSVLEFTITKAQWDQAQEILLATYTNLVGTDFDGIVRIVDENQKTLVETNLNTPSSRRLLAASCSANIEDGKVTIQAGDCNSNAASSHAAPQTLIVALLLLLSSFF
jgi:hypothetical protein